MERHRYDDVFLKAAASALLIFFCGCQTNLTKVASGSVLFGMYAVPKQDLSAAKKLGLDFVVGPKDASYLEAARLANINVIGTGPSYPDHQNLIGNYLSDEPDLRETSPERIEKEYREAKRRSLKPIYLNLSSGFSAELYGQSCDVIMFDWYPIGWQPIETYYANLRGARLAAHGKPFFAVVQAFDWSNYPKMMPPRTSYRAPTAAEVKAMAFWAAMSGASGIAFYAYNDGSTRLDESPELETAIKEAIAFIRKKAEFFEGKREWIPYPFRFENDAEKYNAIFEPSIAVKASRARRGEEGWRIVAANTTDRRIEVRMTGEVELSDRMEHLVFEPFEVKLLTARIHRN